MGKKLGKILKKMTVLRSCSSNWCDTMGLGGEKAWKLRLFWLVKYWHQIMCVD